MKISIKDDLLPENGKKYEEGSGTTDPGYFELDWHHYIQADGFNFTPNQEFTPPLPLPLVYESSFMIGDDFRRVNTDDSNPIRFGFPNGELNLLSLFDTIDENAWYLMANVNLEGPLGQLYPVVISSGDVRGQPGRNIGDVYLNQLTPYGQLHPLQTNKRYWYQVMITTDKQIIVSFRDSTEEGYHVYLQGYLSEAVSLQLASFHGPLSLYWLGLGPEYRIISGTFIRGEERIFTWKPAETQQPLPNSTIESSNNEAFPTPVKTGQVPHQVENFLTNTQALEFDSFGPTSAAYWDLGTIGSTANGMLELIGDKINWSQIGLKRSVLEGEAILFLARYTRGAQFKMYLQSGPWGKERYRSFGINGGGKPSHHLWLGSQYTEDFLTGDFSPEPDRWYYVLMAIDNQAKVVVAIWDPDHPEKQNSFKENMGEESRGQYWGLIFEVFRGTLQIDDFHIISLDNIK
jgi:hypothetical protein